MAVWSRTANLSFGSDLIRYQYSLPMSRYVRDSFRNVSFTNGCTELEGSWMYSSISLYFKLRIMDCLYFITAVAIFIIIILLLLLVVVVVL